MSSVQPTMKAKASGDAVLRCEDLSVFYGGKPALQSASLSLQAGKIHVLVGQNGAGKTSLARVLSGIARPDSGRFWIGGAEVRGGGVQAVRGLGLDMVHQRFTLPPTFTVAEALELVSARKQGGWFFSIKGLGEAWAEEMRAAGMAVSPRTRVRDLPIETVQSLEILRALAGRARILILDEPTALLSPGGVERLFGHLRQLRAGGVTLLIILHKLREVMSIADTVSVLRAGRMVLGASPAGEVTEKGLSELIIGSGESEESARGIRPQSGGQAAEAHAIALKEATTQRSETEPALKKISLVVESGRILGIAGIEGSGQRSLVEVLTGRKPILSGAARLMNRDVTGLKHHERRAIGLRVVPFDRVSEGASLSLPLWENVTSWNAEQYRRGRLPWLDTEAMREAARKALAQFDVQYDSLEQPAGSLSGGNLQRMILARELLDSPRALIVAQPTRGLDFQATRFLWRALRELRDGGAGILLVSSDLDELFHLADRILVLRGGEVVGEHGPEYHRQRIGDDMIGASR